MTNPTQPSSAPSLPMFYRSPALLRYRSHARLGVRREARFQFAAAATAVPLVAGDFVHAARDYPIVFAGDEDALPLAVTGVTAGRNLFVEADGRWRAGSYIPFYVRRYPFIGIMEGGATMLGADLASDRLAVADDADAERLFDAKGGPTKVGQAARDMCDAYAADHARTVAFARALKANGLLSARSAQVNYADAGRAVVQGFQLVDEAAFRALPAPVVAEFHARGWLDLVVLHLASQHRWRDLVNASSKERSRAVN